MKRTSTRAIRVLLTLTLACAPLAACSESDAPDAAEAPAASKAAGHAPSPVAFDEIVAAYASVKDYTARYEKVERSISGGDPQTIEISFRKPLSVRLDWLDDTGKVDQSAVYSKGANGGKVLARRSGGLGTLVGTMRLDPDDPVARADSDHPIAEAGIGTIVDHAAADAARSDVTTTYLGEEQFDGKPAWKLELSTRGASLGGLPKAARSVLWVDETLKLPVASEYYDAKRVLLERHRFTNLRTNVGVPDKTFVL